MDRTDTLHSPLRRQIELAFLRSLLPRSAGLSGPGASADHQGDLALEASPPTSPKANPPLVASRSAVSPASVIASANSLW